ncbi:hypothetical protein AVJ23_19585 [Pseudoponticoccus marisrubri]|uniref:Uncharacterized protein n=1 Tax=Pseudoponticoccus marisrubri TaxID=1685382 RepID=A0A0W7WEK1_9RHOB|nr:hypothetical protein AVJ23_19585 [Pseudoponticoccus marisrubri]
MGVALVLATGFLMVSAGAVVVLTFLSPDRQMRAMAKASEAEIDGRDNLLTRLVTGGGGADVAVNMAVKQAQARLDSGELSADEARKTRAFIAQREGKSAADIVRDNMRPALLLKAQAAGLPHLGQEAARKLDACTSTTCLGYVEAEFEAALHDAGNR